VEVGRLESGERRRRFVVLCGMQDFTKGWMDDSIKAEVSAYAKTRQFRMKFDTR
jgi:hypothetical protein